MEIEIRLECLQIAQRQFPGASAGNILEIADMFYAWVLGDEKD
jgi:hypothetical protein